jgi:hypothetical protein
MLPLRLRVVGGRSDGGEIGLGFADGGQRIVNGLVQRASGLTRGLAARHRRVEHPLLRRVEVELRLGMRDQMTDHVVGRAPAVRTVHARRLCQRGARAKGERQ